MAEFDLGILKPWLAEYEKYAMAIKPGDPRFALAKEMLAIVGEARASLKPSADSTANYVQNKDIIEQLAVLQARARELE